MEAPNIEEKTCELCKNKFHLQEHQSGLVIDDRFFICDDCRSQKAEKEIIEWSQSIMHASGTAMPIALWLIQEENKNKEPFSKRT